MSKFKVGEIVILQSIIFSQYNGKELTIISIENGGFEGNGYVTDFQPGKYAWAESALRKKHGGEQTTTWQSIEQLTSWNPEKVATAEVNEK